MKVTVVIVTYNHERFIGKALESVIVQQANFDFEIVISEDCSTDATRHIVLDWKKRYPDRIRLILSEQNIHNNEVVARAFRVARGTYIALLDGDDFWTCSQKLQLQADFLDRNPQCSMCCHNAEIANDRGVEVPRRYWVSVGQKPESSLEDIWRGNFIPTCSTMFRNGILPEIPSWYATMFPITDWPLYILYAEHGKIGYIDRSMGAYRLHAGGLYSPLSQIEKLERTSRFYKTMNKNLDFRHDQLARESNYSYFFHWALEYRQRGDIRLARECFRKSLAFGLPGRLHLVIKIIKIAITLYVPLVLSWIESKPPSQER
jgi:glycosyltransferase involved in cell wall biosynthesis